MSKSGTRSVLSETDFTKAVVEYNWQYLIDQNKFDREKAESALIVSTPEYLKKCKPLSIEQAISARGASLATVKKYLGEAGMKVVLHKLLYELSDFFNVSKGLSDTQIEILCDFIFEDFHYMTVADLKLCFRRAMKNKTVYNRLDGSVVMEWLREYATERAETGARISQHEHKKVKDQENKNDLREAPKWFRDYLKEKSKNNSKERKGITVEQIKSDPILSAYFQNQYDKSSAKDEGATFDNFLIFETGVINKL